MQFRLPELPIKGIGSGDPPDPIPDEFAGLVREAFPLPAASETLRQRVAQSTAAALALHAGPGLASEGQNVGKSEGRKVGNLSTFRPSDLRLLPHTLTHRLALAGTLATLLLLPLCSTRKGGAGQAFASAPPTPGQLAILDGAGQPLGLCPLKHTDVDAEISGYVARVTVKQEFRNPTSSPVEAIYTFPLPEDAAVDAMTMTLGADRIVKGEIKRREEAREIYEAARDAGQATALLDQERPNIFTQSVANLMPGEQVTIAISYVNTLKYEAGRYEFVFPMVVGPRFTGDSGGYTTWGLRGEPSPVRQFQGDPGSQAVVTDAEKITPPVTPPGVRAGHDISVRVKLDSGLPLQAVHSELHAIDVQREGETQATVQLREQRTLPNKDFILQYDVAGAGLQTGVLAQADANGGGHFTLVVQPPGTPAEAEPRAKEIVFVIDQSGSQSGWPIRKAKETMGYLIRNMNPGDTFQLLGFNTEVNACFERPVSNNPGNVARALRFLEPIEGDGGTDILNAVDYALKIPDDRNRRRIICYLTDGFVGDDMQILDFVRKHRGQAHMFPFGISDAPNRFLITGMAREGHGTAEFVTLNSSAEAAAARFYRRISKPILTEVGIDWNGLPVAEVFPSHIPDLFVSGRPILLKGRFTAPAQGEIILHGSLGGQPWRQAVPVSFGPASDDGDALAALWAREKIEDLQGRDWLGQQTGNPNPAIVEKIVDVALQYGLMSQHTSFVAVEQRVVNLLGKPQVVDIPVELPEGMAYEGIFGRPAPEPNADEQVQDGAGAGVNFLLSNPEPAPVLPQSRANPFAPNRELEGVVTVVPPVVHSPVPNVAPGAGLDNNYVRGLSTDNLGSIVRNSQNLIQPFGTTDGTVYEFNQSRVNTSADNNGGGNGYRPSPTPNVSPGFQATQPPSLNGYVAPVPNERTNSSRQLNGLAYIGDPASDKAGYYNVVQPKPQRKAAANYPMFFDLTENLEAGGALAGDGGAQRQQQQQGQGPSWYYPPQGQRLPQISAAKRLPRGRQFGMSWSNVPTEDGLATDIGTGAVDSMQFSTNAAPPVTDPVGKAPANRYPAIVPKSEVATDAPSSVDDLNAWLYRRNGQAPKTPGMNRLTRDSGQLQSPAPARPTLAKLAGPLLQRVLLARKSLKEANGAIDGRWEGDRRVAVQLWIGPLPADGLRKIQEAGFEAVTVLRPGLVTLGTIRVGDLEKLAALPFVLYLDPPQLR